MDKRFSYDVEQVFVIAEELGRSMSHPVIGSEHLLLAILKYGNNILNDELNKKGVKYKNLYDKIKKLYIYENGNELDLKYSIELNDIIDKTKEFSHKNKESSVTLNSIIFTMINLKNAASDLLKYYGINIDFISSNLIENKRKKFNNLGINDLHLMGVKNRDLLIGRNKEMMKIIYALARRNKPNAILIGDPGVGKTAIVEEIAKRLVNDEIKELEGKLIFELDIASTLGGTKYRGEFEEKLKKIINRVKEEGNIILFIDEIHSIVKAGGAEGAIDASNILKPYLARADIQIIGATTKEEFNDSFEKDKALKRRFQIINILENTYEDTKTILRGIKKVYEDFHHIIISDEMIDYIVDNANKYLLNQKFPDKAIELLDNSCVRGSEILKKEDVDITLNSIFNIDLDSKKIDLFLEEYSKCDFYEEKIRIQIENVLRKNHGYMMFIGRKEKYKNKTLELLISTVYKGDNIIINSRLFSRKQNILTKGFESEKYNELVALLKDNPSSLIVFKNVDLCDEETLDFFKKMIENEYIKDEGNNKISIAKSLFVFMCSNEMKNSFSMNKCVKDNSNYNNKILKIFDEETLAKFDEIIEFSEEVIMN